MSRNAKRRQSNDGDHISKLPESLISNILSRLSTKVAVRTSTLSKDWEYKWTSILNVVVDDKERFSSGKRKRNKTSFQNFMDRILLHSHYLIKFRLVCKEKYKFSRLEAWISSVLRPSIESFELQLFGSENLVLPRSLLNNTSLRELKLMSPCTFKVPHDNYFPNITYLYLQEVNILNELSDNGPTVFMFPVLKTFQLIKCKWLSVKLVEIHSPALSTFKCKTSPWSGATLYSIKICGARLANFELSGGFPENIILNESNVLSAVLDNSYRGGYLKLNVRESGLRVGKLLERFSDIMTLQLSSWTCEVIAKSKQKLTLGKYDNLQRLDMYVGGNAKLLLALLHSAPSLKFLDIDLRDESLDAIDRDVAESVPYCVASCLKEITFKCSFYKLPPMHLAKFFLEKGLELRKVYVVGNISCKDEFIEQLLMLPRASACLAIVSK